MNDLVGIIRQGRGDRAGAGRAWHDLRGAGGQGQRRRAAGSYNPGWHLALDLRNMLVVSECTAKAALERQESRGGHTRDDFPAMEPEWRKVNLVCSLRRRRASRLDAQAAADDARRPARPVRPDRAGEVPDRRGAGRRRRALAATAKEPTVMGTTRHFRVWRGDDDRRRPRGLQGRGQRGRGRPRRHPPAAGHPGAGPGGAVELQGRQVRLLLAWRSTASRGWAA